MVVQQSTRIVSPSNDLAYELSQLDKLGGGIVYLTKGFFEFFEDIVVPSNMQILGLGPSDSILAFSGNFGLITQSSGLYTTGTIVSIVGNVVTGLGTSWLENVSVGQSLFVGTQWYPIADIPNDTTIILGQDYSDDVSLPTTYRIATITTDITLGNFAVQGSSGMGISISDAEVISIENVNSVENNVGFAFTNVSQLFLDRMLAAVNVSDGIQVTNVGLSDWSAVNAVSNGGNAITMKNVESIGGGPINVSGNVGDGLNVTDASNMAFFGTLNGNGGNGVQIVAGGVASQIYNSSIEGNTANGILFTASAEVMKVYANTIGSNGAYGMSIADASSSGNIISINSFSGNTSGEVSDSGTGTLIRSNIGVTDN